MKYLLLIAGLLSLFLLGGCMSKNKATGCYTLNETNEYAVLSCNYDDSQKCVIQDKISKEFKPCITETPINK